MKEEHNNKTWYIIGGVIIVLLIVLLISINSNSNRGPVCSSPYILNGNSCCLDQDYNGICDSDQPKPQVQEPTYKDFKINFLVTHDGYMAREGLPSFADNSIYANYPLTGLTYTPGGAELYNAGSIYIYTDSTEVDQKITCYVKEYYDSRLNGQFTMELNTWKTFAMTNIGYEKSPQIKEARYDYECTGEQSNRKQIGSVKVLPSYPSSN